MRPILLACAAFGLAVIAHADEAARPPLYYQDPDGKPSYAPAPRQTADGRDFRPVFAEDSSVPTKTEPAVKPPGSDGRRVLYYRNPMGLSDTSLKPKKDSMGMDYLPVYADEGTPNDAPGTVRISPGRMQILGVRTEAAEMRPAESRAVRATGILRFDERHLATVTTKVPGWIEHLAVAATGDAVHRGQVLAEIYAPDLVASEEEYLVAARMGGAIGAASDQRLRALDIPQTEIARLRRTGQSSRRIAIVAPADGVVIDKPVQDGMRVEAGEALYRTADLSSIWLIAQVPEQDLAMIRAGEPARATFVAFPSRTFDGKVDFIYPTLSVETRTGQVRIVLPNPDGALRAAMYANVLIDNSAGGEPILSVPNSSVLDSGARQIVLVASGEGRFEPRQVHLGLRGDDRVQVLDGLKSGEQVVVGANFLIDAESNLRAALRGFAEQGTAR
ncbi:MAG: rane fusion protein copper/silver efflux system [Aliidongia sp.]|jgi:Cu(I)/Ag(I) efflux system membrane fusion protein|nr:rane fusion protein copper/silver efflux system [Aliidongia sp.]